MWTSERRKVNSVPVSTILRYADICYNSMHQAVDFSAFFAEYNVGRTVNGCDIL
jgi:hypothetical protein